MASSEIPLGTEPPKRLPLKHKFTEQEKQAVRECNRESFWFSSVPLMALFSGIINYGYAKGYLKMKKRTPYAMLRPLGAACAMGFFLGKILYRKKCEEKFMRLRDSQIGDYYRYKNEEQFKKSLDSGDVESISEISVKKQENFSFTEEEESTS